jgi:site-specific recombinase XerD
MAKHLGRLVELLGASSPAEEFPWADLDYATTLRLRQALVARYAPATANLALAALRGVLREAWRLGDMSNETFKRVSDLAQVRGDRLRPRRPIDTGSFDKLVAVTGNDETRRGRRDFAMLSVLFGAGLRRSELIQLDLAHVAGNCLMVLGKGQQWRTVFLEHAAAAALDGWIELRGTAPGALFCAIHRSGALRPGRLTSEAVARIVTHRARAAGVGELRPHDLRRAFATRLLETGTDVLLVQRILGHWSVSTTMVYDRRLDRASGLA